MSLLLLAFLTAALVLAFFLVMAFFLIKIGSVLRSIGGTPTSYLARLRLGLRAIEVETGHLPPQAAAANEGLARVGAGLGAVDKHLAGVIESASKQERYR